MSKEYIRITEIKFPGKKPDLKIVENFLKSSLGKGYIVQEYGDYIKIGSRFASEYCGSQYTKKLRGALLKAKANAATILPELIRDAHNRRYIENREEKHKNDANKGWYRYDVLFSVPVYDDKGFLVHDNLYSATLIARINDQGIFLHDMVNIKKEASKPFES